MLSSFSSPLNSIPDIPGIISVVTAGIISVMIGGHFGGGDHFDGGDHFGGGTMVRPLSYLFIKIPVKATYLGIYCLGSLFAKLF